MTNSTFDRQHQVMLSSRRDHSNEVTTDFCLKRSPRWNKDRGVEPWRVSWAFPTQVDERTGCKHLRQRHTNAFGVANTAWEVVDSPDAVTRLVVEYHLPLQRCRSHHLRFSPQPFHGILGPNHRTHDNSEILIPASPRPVDRCSLGSRLDGVGAQI